MLSLLNRPTKKQCHDGMALLLIAALLVGGFNAYAATKPKVHIVVIEAMQFSPKIVEVNSGDTVIWKNKDPFPHTATSDNRSFKSGEIPANRSWKFVARKKGNFPYSCALHSTMKGTLIVK
ncbi:MAG: cupredoxin family copper-binding protein [bacterium]